MSNNSGCGIPIACLLACGLLDVGAEWWKTSHTPKEQLRREQRVDFGLPAEAYDVQERGGRWVTFRVVIDGEAHTFLLRRRDSVNYDSGVLVQVK